MKGKSSKTSGTGTKTGTRTGTNQSSAANRTGGTASKSKTIKFDKNNTYIYR